jgi:hypothetical protein
MWLVSRLEEKGSVAVINAPKAQPGFGLVAMLAAKTLERALAEKTNAA